MGMFDYLIVQMPFPENPPPWVPPWVAGSEFQTKSFDNPGLNRYTITREGRLLDPHGQPYDFTGDLTFWTGNMMAAADGVPYTRDGEDAESVCYLAVVRHGEVWGGLELLRHERSPARPIREFPPERPVYGKTAG